MRKEWWTKLFVAGWGLLIGGCVFLFVGGTALKGVAFLSSQKQHFSIRFQLEIAHLGDRALSEFWS